MVERLTTTLAGAPLEIVRTSAGCVATLGGERRPIRLSVERGTASESGSGRAREPTRGEGGAVDLTALWRCLALGVTPAVAPGRVELEATDNWGHFRQNTFLHVRITLAADGAIEIAVSISEQDESYY